ncbi:MAG: hypothetical protein QXV75_08520 [Candidatus Bathyarchaeia archaeon]
MEAVKSYRIPVEAPRDLIEEYFKVKQKALDAIFSHVKISKKAHLEFDRKDRKERERCRNSQVLAKPTRK